MYYRGAHAAVVVYDITNQDSFKRATSWVNELRERAPGVKVIALAGNKSDRHQDRVVAEHVSFQALACLPFLGIFCMCIFKI